MIAINDNTVYDVATTTMYHLDTGFSSSSDYNVSAWKVGNERPLVLATGKDDTRRLWSALCLLVE